MFKKLFSIALLAAIPCLFVTPAAKADDLALNQWYTAQFGNTWPSSVSGGNLYGDGTDGPVLGGGTANSIDAPAGTVWTITLAGPGTLTVTDIERSGDQFVLLDNGTPMLLAPSPFTAAGQNPGQPGLAGGYTSTPVAAVDFVGSDINAALGDANFSSGTFALDAGLNSIQIEYEGVEGQGDMAFIAESTPEPSSLLLFGSGLLGIAFAFRRKLMA